MAVLTNSTLTILADASSAAAFEATLAAHRCGPLLREETRTLQINVGKLCNQACHHCHVDAGPKFRRSTRDVNHFDRAAPWFAGLPRGS